MGKVRKVKKLRHAGAGQLPLNFEREAPVSRASTSAAVLKFPGQVERKTESQDKAVSRIVEKAKKLPW
jgi:hypothetical protein